MKARECEVCGYEFKYEYGWEFITKKYSKYGAVSIGDIYLYLCQQCAFTYHMADEKAREIIEKRKNSRPSKPDPPPPPPKGEK